MFACLTASCVVRFGDRTSYRYRKQAFTLHLMFSCLNKNLFLCSLVFQNNLFLCSSVFPKTMFFCSLVSQKKHVLIMDQKPCSSVLLSLKKNMFLCSSVFPKTMFFCPPTALNFYQVAHNRIAHKQSLSCQSQVVVAQLYSAVA